MAIVPVEKLRKDGMSLYEVAVAAAKEVRKRNELRRLKREAGEMDEHEDATQVTVEVLLELAEGRARCVYPGHRRKESAPRRHGVHGETLEESC